MAKLFFDPSTGRGTGYGDPDGSFEVKFLQEWLNMFAGQEVETDGKFGPGTKAAVQRVQSLFNMETDGVVGDDFRDLQTYVEGYRSDEIEELVRGYNQETGSQADLVDQINMLAPAGVDIDLYLDQLDVDLNNLGGFSTDDDDNSGVLNVFDMIEGAFDEAFGGGDDDGTPPDEELLLIQEENQRLLDELNEFKEKAEEKDTPVGIIFAEPDETQQQRFVTSLVDAVGIQESQANELWDIISNSWINDPMYTIDDVLIDLYDTPAFKERFVGITELRNARDDAVTQEEKLAFDIPTIKEYLDLEDVLLSEMANLGQTNFNINELMTRVTAVGVDAREAQERFQAARRIMGATVPEEIENKFKEWYSDQGEGNLIWAFLDPEDETGIVKSWDQIQAEVGAAEVAGLADFAGELQLAQSQAERINSLNRSTNELWDSFARIKAADNLFIEKIGEEDFIAEEEGIASEFFGDDSLLQRRDSRLAAFRGGGGAMLTQEGTGLGSA